MRPIPELFESPSNASNLLMSPKMKRVLMHIHLYYGKNIHLKDVASLIDIHPAYLCRRFKKELGIPFHVYLLRTRIQIAAYLLSCSEKSIKEISYSVGFSRPEIFSKAFKRLAGCSPKTYRMQALSISGDSDRGASFLDLQHIVSMRNRPDVFSIQPFK